MVHKIVSAIDVGTTKIATIVADINPQGSIEVLGVGVVPSHGLHKGIVVNMDEAKASIASSIKEAQTISGVRIIPLMWELPADMSAVLTTTEL